MITAEPVKAPARKSRTRFDQMTSDLLGLMDHRKIDRASLIGHSTGGAIGQVMAISHRERLNRLARRP